MPAIVTQKPPAPIQASPPSAFGGVLGTALATGRTRFQKVCIYGRNRVGKSTLAAQWEKPMLWFACEPAEDGGIGSVDGTPGLTPIWISQKPQIDPRTGTLETIYGTAKLDAAFTELMALWRQTGQFPFKTVVIDTVTALQDIALTEIMGWVDKPVSLMRGDVSRQQFGQRSAKTCELMRKAKDLPCHVVFVAQQKDHNPPKDEDQKVSKMLDRELDQSFFGASLGDTAAGWLHDSCDYVGRLYAASEVKEHVTTMKVGNETRNESMWLPTGRQTRRFQTVYKTNYAGGFRSPVPEVVPEYIECITAQEMYQEIAKVIGGQKTAKGKYS